MLYSGDSELNKLQSLKESIWEDKQVYKLLQQGVMTSETEICMGA